MIKKEHDLLSRYERAHPHFIRYLALDAVVTVAVVFGVFQFVQGNASTIESQEPLEMSAGSSSALIAQTNHEKLDAYWLGPISGYKYTLNDQQSGIVDIFYWPASSGNSDPHNYLYEVKTYQDRKIWNAHTHPILASANTSEIAIKNGVSIRINRSSMKGVIATYTNKPEILAIAYPTAQTLDSMIKDVESLRLAG